MAVLRLLLSLLIAWLILADCLLARQATAFPHPTAGIMLGLLLGEASLLSTWFACSRQNWVVRLAITGATMAILAWPAALYSGPSWRQWVGLLLLFSAATTGVWKLVHAAGWKWRTYAAENYGSPSKLRAGQVSLATLLEWITTAAVMLGMGSWLALPDKQPILAAISIVLLAALPPILLAAMLAETRFVWSRGLWIVVALALGLAIVALQGGGNQAAFMAIVAGTQALVVLAAACLLSIGGAAIAPATESTAQDDWSRATYPRAGAL